MFLLHYILPLVIFYFYRDKIMLWGLIIGNWIDLDHIWLRITGKVGWFESACTRLGENCSIGTYPLHNWNLAFFALTLGVLVFHEDKKLRFIGWFGIGMFLAISLDWIHQVTGFYI